MLTLHIGTPKTGSSSIQEALWINRDRVKQNGISFCHALGPTNNIDLFLACLHHDEWGFGILEERGICGEEKRNSFRKDVIDRLKKVHETTGSVVPQNNQLVASSEHLWFLWSDVHFRNLKQILDGSGVELASVIVYLRPQPHLLYSALSTMVRDGFAVAEVDPSCVSLHEFRYLNYWDALKQWKAYFPNVPINARWYDDHKHDIVNDFFNVCGIPVDGITAPPRMNTSLSSLGVAVMCELNRRFLTGLDPLSVARALNENNPRSKVAALVEKHFAGTPLPSREACMSIEAYFEESNSLLIRDYLPSLALNDFANKAEVMHAVDASAYKAASIGIVDLALELMEHQK